MPPFGYHIPSLVCMCAIRAKDSRGVVGRRADILSKMVDHLSDPRFRDIGSNGAAALLPILMPEDVPEQRRSKHPAPVDHVKEAANRSVEKEILRNTVESFRKLHEVGITLSQ